MARRENKKKGNDDEPKQQSPSKAVDNNVSNESRNDRRRERTKQLVGRDVKVRTKDGPRIGRVTEVINATEARGLLKNPRARASQYLVVDGINHPIQRRRAKLV